MQGLEDAAEVFVAEEVLVERVDREELAEEGLELGGEGQDGVAGAFDGEVVVVGAELDLEVVLEVGEGGLVSLPSSS